MQSSLCCQHVQILVISLAQMTLTVPVILCSLNAHCFAWLADGGPESQTDQFQVHFQLFWGLTAELWGTEVGSCCVH